MKFRQHRNAQFRYNSMKFICWFHGYTANKSAQVESVPREPHLRFTKCQIQPRIHVILFFHMLKYQKKWQNDISSCENS